MVFGKSFDRFSRTFFDRFLETFCIVLEFTQSNMR